MSGQSVLGPGKSRRKNSARAGIVERRECAFQAYLEVLETAAWFRYEVEPQLADFDLNIERFLLLEMLYREGAMTTVEAGKRRYCTRQSLFRFAERVESRGWIEIERETLPAAEIEEAKLPREKRQQDRSGRCVASLRLTDKGRSLITGALRRHAKLIYALMRGIDMQEAKRLSRTCQKIREGNVMKLIKELMMQDED